MVNKILKPWSACLAGLIFSQLTTAAGAKPEFVELQTNLGTIAVQLDYAHAPITADNFIGYVKTGFYKNTLIHRTVKDSISIIQGGGFDLSTGKIKPTGSPIALESNNGLSNLAGTIAMARTHVPRSATSQFYINVKDNLGLDYRSPSNPGYAVFGTVIDGLEVAANIMNLPSFNSLPFTASSSLVFVETTYTSSHFDTRLSKTRILRKGRGTVTSTPSGIRCGRRCKLTQNAGAPLRLTATPRDGYVFSGWRGDCNGVNRTLTIDTRQGNHNCTALFSKLGASTR